MNARTLAALGLILSAAPLWAADAPSTDGDKTLYSYGYFVGQTIASVGFDASELKTVLAGLQDAAGEKKSPFDISEYKPKISDVLHKHLAAKAQKTKAEGKAFASKFAKEKGVAAIPKGGYIQIAEKGDGAAPAAEDTVKVNYRGTLIDGTEFDSSYKRKEPVTFPLNRVIPCWSNGVAKMHVHGKAKLVCPPEVAYGDDGHPPVIPGGSTLVFEVELLDIVKPDGKPESSSASTDSK